MQAKFTVLDDPIEREAFKAMRESASFRLYLNRIGIELSRAEELCVRSDSRLDIHRAQGRVTALRTALELPQKMYDEMQNARR